MSYSLDRFALSEISMPLPILTNRMCMLPRCADSSGLSFIISISTTLVAADFFGRLSHAWRR